MQDFGIVQVLYAVGSLCVVSIIGFLWKYRARIVSSVSGGWTSSIDRGRRQKAARERRYGYADLSYDMSSSDENEPVPVAGPGAVPAPSLGTGAVDVATLASSLTEAQYIELGARLRDRRGKPVFSGKKLYTLAGGNHDEFLASMRRWRGDEPTEEEPGYTTPIVGRPTAARFETDPEYPYQAPAR